MNIEFAPTWPGALLFVLVAIPSCVSAHDRALAALAEASGVSSRAEAHLAQQCTAAYELAATPEQVRKIDAQCIPARNALAAYRDAYAQLIDLTDKGLDDATLEGQIRDLQARAAVLP